MDSRYEKLAHNLINHSCQLKNEENVLIEAFDMPEEMIIALIKAARAVGGFPLVTLKNNRILREMYMDTDEGHM